MKFFETEMSHSDSAQEMGCRFKYCRGQNPFCVNKNLLMVNQWQWKMVNVHKMTFGLESINS